MGILIIEVSSHLRPATRSAPWPLMAAKAATWLRRMHYYVLDSADNLHFLCSCRNKLLKFGIHFPAPSGSSYWLGSDGTPCTDRERETWITARMGHVYSLASMLATLMLSLYWLHAAQNLQAFMELQS